MILDGPVTQPPYSVIRAGQETVCESKVVASFIVILMCFGDYYIGQSRDLSQRPPVIAELLTYFFFTLFFCF